MPQPQKIGLQHDDGQAYRAEVLAQYRASTAAGVRWCAKHDAGDEV